MSSTVHILFENPAWNPPLVEALEAAGFRVQLHFLDDGIIDPGVPPAEGIWINRISPSSHTRGHEGTVPLGREYLAWLEHYGRRVINGSAAFEIEMSKLRQDLVLRRHGIRTPRTTLAVGRTSLIALARTFDGPFITKHNRGGKGLGIRLFHSAEHLE
jgi:glutathione synthase/RimK-type ligase-like ATP-grasp enzyme